MPERNPTPRLDLAALALDSDREMRAALLDDPQFRELVEETEASAVLASARRARLLESMRLTRHVAPDFFAALDRVMERLGIEAEIEAYDLAAPLPNAFVTPPEQGRLLLGVSSASLERLDVAELTFMLGHELGHVLLDHFSLTPEVLESDGRLAPAQLARYYAWMRYAELSADRVGLVCGEDPDAAVRAFFKLTPYSPLRLRALEVFARSRTYHALVGKAGGELDEAELEREVAAIMQLMDPSSLSDRRDASIDVRDFLALAGVAVAAADGKVVEAEHELVIELVGPEGRLSDGTLIEELGDEEFERRVLGIAEKLCLRVSPERRQEILKDLVAIALADDDLAEAEVEVLGTAAIWLGIDPRFVEEAIARHASALD